LVAVTKASQCPSPAPRRHNLRDFVHDENKERLARTSTAAVTGRISKIAGRNADDAELRVHAGRREDLARFYEVRDDLGRRREGSSLVGEMSASVP
jgi:hypothetical protein